MNKKRIVALLAAAVMLLSTVPVFADEVGSGSATDVNEVTGGSTTVTGEATVNDVDKNKPLKVVLPTENVLKFIVDPHNLVGMSSGDATTLNITATGEGAIIAPEDALAVIKNMSNVPVIVDATFSLVASGSAINFVTDQAAVTSGTAANMFLVVVPSIQEAWNAETYVTTDQAFVIDDDGTEVSYKLEAASWEVIKNADGSFTYDYDRDEVNNWDAVAFKMGGVVNKAADWSPYKDNLTFTVVFDVAKADTEEKATNSVVYGLVSGSATTTVYTPVVVEAEEVDPISAYVDYLDSMDYFWLGEDASTPFDTDAVLTNAKVNGEAVTARFENGYVIFDWANVEPKAPSAPWTFTFELDGVAYTATYDFN